MRRIDGGDTTTLGAARRRAGTPSALIDTLLRQATRVFPGSTIEGIDVPAPMATNRSSVRSYRSGSVGARSTNVCNARHRGLQKLMPGFVHPSIVATGKRQGALLAAIQDRAQTGLTTWAAG